MCTLILCTTLLKKTQENVHNIAVDSKLRWSLKQHKEVCRVKSNTICWIFCWQPTSLRATNGKLWNFVKIVINLGFFAANQTEDIWNISSRVNHEPIQQANWSPHDGRVSSQDFVLVPEYSMADNKPPPPPYSEGKP